MRRHALATIIAALAVAITPAGASAHRYSHRTVSALDRVTAAGRPHVSDYVDRVISQIEACSRRARRHQGAQLDAQLVEIVHRLGGSTRTSLPRPSLCAIAHALSIWAYV